MPSISVHLTISARLAEVLGIKDLPDYYLGAIAPDAVNTDGFASQELRYGAHIRSKDQSVWKRNIADFRRANADRYADRPDFFTGFLIHLYTDIAWDETVQPMLFDHLRAQGVAEVELGSRKWDELWSFDSLLSQRGEYMSAVGELKKSGSAAVTTVSAEQLSKWRDKVVSLEYDYPPSGFLCGEHIDIAAARTIELYRAGIE